jgi:hypothetical protein
MTGFEPAEIEALEAKKNPGLTDPDAVPDEPEDAITQAGDIWTLGAHRLICGDATAPDDVERLLAGVTPLLMVTDPPYGIDFNYSSHDDSSRDGNASLVELAFNLAPDGKCWTPGLMNLARDITRFGDAKVLAWHKLFASAGSGLGGASTWEPVLVVDPPRTNLKNNYLRFGTDRENVDGVSLLELHPCPKPVALYALLVASFTEVGTRIYDPFLGSGTTLIAAEMEGRVCYGLEIDPIYCDVIVQRWQEFTGNEATRTPA